MAKFVSAISLALIVVFFLGGCATQEGGRYDWVNLEKHKKPSEKEAAEEPSRYESPRPEEKKEVAEKPGRFDWLKTEPEEEEEAAKEPSRYEAPRPEERKEVAEKPGRFDWLKTEPEEEEEAAEEPSRYEAPKPEEKKEIAEKPGRFDWLETEPEEEKEEVEKPERYDWLETEPKEEKEEVEKPERYDWATREPEEEEERAPLGEPGDLDLKLDYWMTEGRQVYSIGYSGAKISELDWTGDANFLVLTGEYRFLDRWSVDASYGTADFEGWDQTDTDWWPPGAAIPFSYTQADSEGEGSFWMVDLYYRFWTNDISFLDAFLGYQYNENFFRDTNLVQLIPALGPYPGLNSTYQGEYQAIRLGVRGETPLTSNPEWTLEGSLAYLPWVEAEGKGFWNLRADPAPPYSVGMHIKKKGGEGEGIDAYVAVNYRPHRCPNLTLELGYRYMELKTRGGTSQNYWPGGTYATPTDWIDNKCRFRGFFFGLAYRF